jgi:formamidopyrimidine-DNA glycosylase
VPELPEVETVVRDLKPLLVGQRFTDVRSCCLTLRRPWFQQWNYDLSGCKVSNLARRGKWIIIRFTDDQHLLIHLGMTGQLTVVPGQIDLDPHIHWEADLGYGNKQLRFRDIRRFGSLTCLADAQALEEFFQSMALGPEPFAVTKRYWLEALGKTERCLKAVLLDQHMVAGVGNIYADESLFQARLHPETVACRLAEAEAERLRKSVILVLTRAIDQRGSSIRNYVGGSGLKGKYQDEFRVYGRAGEPCPRCRGPIERIRLAGRSTHFCSHCQAKASRRKSKPGSKSGR